jgi:hypothetical protein
MYHLHNFCGLTNREIIRNHASEISLTIRKHCCRRPNNRRPARSNGAARTLLTGFV